MNNTAPHPVMIAAGGTGGHVFPALVVAQKLAQRGVPVIWVGTRRGIESRVVPDAGIAIEWLHVSGLRGKGLVRTLLAPFGILRSVWESVRVIRKYKPISVLGMGGFVTGPVGLAAKLMRRPLVLHEQNAIPGMTNRWLSGVATRVLQAFPDAFETSVKAETVGNPLRSGIEKNSESVVRDAEFHVLIVGGSLGARYFNETLPEAFALLEKRYSIRHQTGRDNQAVVKAAYKRFGLEIYVNVLEFIEDMQEAYRWADFVICRAGAMTVSELAASGSPSILVPFPFAVDDHQTKNARFLSDTGAALLVQQSELSPELLGEKIVALSDHEVLIGMSEKARQSAVLDAGEKIADILLEVAA